MNELIGLIVRRTGLSEEQARKAAELTLEFLKSKLPPPVAAQIGMMLGESDAGKEMRRHLEGFFGRK